MYFIQGIGDPTSGLITQPIRSLLKSWGESPSSMGSFMALLSIPWMVKPAFGLLSDFVPIARSHRRNYLLLSSAAAAIGSFVLFASPLPVGARWLLLFWLLLPTIGIAFGDVLVDALMVEVGQPRGLTGRLQSIQWTAASAALVVAGVAGGYVSSLGRDDLAFLACGVIWIVSFLLAYRFALETPRPLGTETFAATARGLVDAISVPGMRVVIGILFLWSFNPSWVTVQYLHVTDTLGLGEQVYGNSNSVFWGGCIVASLAYGFYCRRVPMGTLVHLAIATGVLGYAVYVELANARVLYAVSFVSGFANMTGTLIQLDVAARLVPIRVAATCFAVLMSITNIASSISEWLGADAYEWLGDRIGAVGAYRAIVASSALFAASCWLLVPRLKREVPAWWRGSPTE
jgi:MFS family permease